MQMQMTVKRECRLARKFRPWLGGLGLLCLLLGCAAPRWLWPEKDIDPSGPPGKGGSRTVLIASRSSTFKEALAAELQRQLAAAGIPCLTVGVDGLKQVDAADYGAVVIVSTCLAWSLDPEVQGFLDRQEKYANLILLTTSGKGNWLPDKAGRDYDAVSGASQMTAVDAVAQDLMARIKMRLEGAGAMPGD